MAFTICATTSACNKPRVATEPALALPASHRTAVEPPPQPDLSGFVVISAEETVFVPVEPSRDVRVWPGLWVADGAEGLVGRAQIEVDDLSSDPLGGLRFCPTGTRGGECFADPSLTLDATLQVNARGDTIVTPECACIVLEGVSTDDSDGDGDLRSTPKDVAEQAAYSPYGPETYIEMCTGDAVEVVTAPAAVLGGVLFETTVHSNQACSGVHIWDAIAYSDMLRPGGAFPAPSRADRCRHTGDDFDTDWILREAEDCIAGDEECEDYCFDGDEGTLFIGRRGALVYVEGAASSAAGTCVCAAPPVALAGACPSVFDPCGTPDGFDGLDDAVDFWVSTDNRYALVLRGEALQLMQPHSAVRVVKAPSDILGVEYHPSLPRTEPPDLSRLGGLNMPDIDTRGDSARELGNNCFKHISAGELDEAEAHCIAALREGGSDKVRGAVTYNLGLIADKRGHRARAQAFYGRSLQLRENATVRAKLTTRG